LVDGLVKKIQLANFYSFEGKIVKEKAFEKSVAKELYFEMTMNENPAPFLSGVYL
jgi:hypothetical protein